MMLMTGRMLLVCALCVLWWCLSGIAADGADVVYGTLGCGGNARRRSPEGQEAGRMRPPLRNVCVR
ncbi:hypothetical protein TcYC6_0051140 [Trypanosoma cruzi]|nr:hypothetical protein TcYC6_0051140 [Trypanosoma cruzi]